MVLRLVDIVLTLRHLVVEVAVRRTDRAVVGHRAPTVENPLQQRLAVDGVLERQAHVVVVEGRLVGVHGYRVVLGPRHLIDFDALGLLEQLQGLDLGLVQDVDLPGDERGVLGHRVRDSEQLGLVEPPSIGLEVVGVALEIHADARYVPLQGIRPGAVRILPLDRVLAFGGQNSQVVIGEQVGQIGVTLSELSTTTVCFPSARTSTILSTIDLAADLVSGPR